MSNQSRQTVERKKSYALIRCFESIELRFLYGMSYASVEISTFRLGEVSRACDDAAKVMSLTKRMRMN
jgi:hypothetical protein